MQRQLTHLLYVVVVVVTKGSFLSVASRRCIAHWGGGGAADDHKRASLYFNISTGFLHRPDFRPPPFAALAVKFMIKRKKD